MSMNKKPQIPTHICHVFVCQLQRYANANDLDDKNHSGNNQIMLLSYQNYCECGLRASQCRRRPCWQWLSLTLCQHWPWAMTLTEAKEAKVDVWPHMDLFFRGCVSEYCVCCVCRTCYMPSMPSITSVKCGVQVIQSSEMMLSKLIITLLSTAIYW